MTDKTHSFSNSVLFKVSHSFCLGINGKQLKNMIPNNNTYVNNLVDIHSVVPIDFRNSTSNSSRNFVGSLIKCSHLFFDCLVCGHACPQTRLPQNVMNPNILCCTEYGFEVIFIISDLCSFYYIIFYVQCKFVSKLTLFCFFLVVTDVM